VGEKGASGSKGEIGAKGTVGSKVKLILKIKRLISCFILLILQLKRGTKEKCLMIILINLKI
jgi:hypothetical protein